jgi:hypothetical protein
MNRDEIIRIAEQTKKYAKVDKMGIVAVLSEDVGGLTYVARWVRTDLIQDFPEGATWAEMTGVRHDNG